jgi:hypothetical protein
MLHEVLLSTCTYPVRSPSWTACSRSKDTTMAWVEGSQKTCRKLRGQSAASILDSAARHSTACPCKRMSRRSCCAGSSAFAQSNASHESKKGSEYDCSAANGSAAHQHSSWATHRGHRFHRSISMKGAFACVVLASKTSCIHVASSLMRTISMFSCLHHCSTRNATGLLIPGNWSSCSCMQPA